MRKEFDENTTRLLIKEAALSSMNLAVGLTFIRRYNFAQLGFIYQAFFSLSVGIERLIKLIILYDYLFMHDHFPQKDYLKAKGHNISLLYSEARALSKKYSADIFFNELNNNEIIKNIIGNLSDFAEKNRYFQLDKLSGLNKSDDPVARWDREVNELIVDLHFNPNTKNNRFMMALTEPLDKRTLVFFHDEQDRIINKTQDFVIQSLTAITKQKYSMYYCFCIINALCELQRNQYDFLSSNAFLYEFFTIFRMDHKKALNKKSWNPHAPYKL